MSQEKSVLLKIKNLRIEGYSDEKWIEIVHGIDLTLHRGEVMGLIGESGAGKSTIGLAAMGFTRDGCRISEGSSIEFDGMELTTTPQADLQSLRGGAPAKSASLPELWSTGARRVEAGQPGNELDAHRRGDRARVGHRSPAIRRLDGLRRGAR